MSLGSHQRSIGKSQVHITPKWIIGALGPFDLDPCAAFPRPWNCAQTSISLPSNGLDATWQGFVWLNPPFHRYQVDNWIKKLAKHPGGGIALLHARTETAWFQTCWQQADGFLFLPRRLTFCKPDGTPSTTLKGEVANSGAPPVFVAFGDKAFKRLRNSGITGAWVYGWNTSR